jgi:hypothetical protein
MWDRVLSCAEFRERASQALVGRVLELLVEPAIRENPRLRDNVGHVFASSADALLGE